MTLDELEDYYREEHGYTTEDLLDAWEIRECHMVMSKRIKELERRLEIAEDDADLGFGD